MQKAFATYVEQHQLVVQGSKVLAGVSGGVDSVAMAQLLHSQGLLGAIAHAHFGLRGVDADADAALVMALAERLEVPFFIQQFNTRSEADAAGESIQMAARRLRFAWFEELLDEHALGAVAVAAHLDLSLIHI